MAVPVVIAATAKHTGTLIFLHGLGDTGQGWASAIGAIRPPHVKVICPTAPTMKVTLNAGFRMPSWFDLKTLDESGPEDEEGYYKFIGRHGDLGNHRRYKVGQMGAKLKRLAMRMCN